MMNVDAWEIVMRHIQPHDPMLAARINKLLWAYERRNFRDRIFLEPLIRRHPRQNPFLPSAPGHEQRDRA